MATKKTKIAEDKEVVSTNDALSLVEDFSKKLLDLYLRVGSGIAISTIILAILATYFDSTWISSKRFIDLFIRLLMFEGLFMATIVGFHDSGFLLILGILGFDKFDITC